MGNDGGSIPTRRELVKEAAKNPSATDLKEKQREHLAHRWSQCPVSHKALTKPIVSDYSGDLYNKDAIIQYLLPVEVSGIDKKEYDAFIQGRIKGLKDVVEVQFEVEKDDTLKTEKRVCPITGKELGVGVKAVYLVPCGHAFSQEAVRQIGTGECSVCNAKYEERDVVPILPSTDIDKEFVMNRMNTLRELGLTHSLKKDKSSKKRKATGDDNGKKEKTNGENAEKSGTSKNESSNGIKNSATASLTKRVLEEENAKKKRKLENENISSLYSKKNGEKLRDNEFMTRGFSVR
ncbi:uncharacterized protein HMPREF1541_01203 [Cyphellophora europaea CBS 101466]|uniref:Uncharacterized protein n=1 Tax=Cyphellophora europaea (strain CBS 101466) TaxID=1220924 RepID=W2SG86_CYPE1|nr:uncharacterized protein HMPREF1541_01203 [Cyphellophora europaea CBS 101466]ETN47013.1 hypothetical protein HMPREF1541_01203 [Cyphellophora europaea CBS 101466]